ncbi:MAG: LysR family transcriptional regulator [Betaproteobacteria bacterium]|nr:LysR family transcriptional regulator [Betaproteobacteria bacterium]
MSLPPVQLRNFDLNLLKVFDVVMAERSLTRAAPILALTQPAVSNAMRRLRDALGDEVLVRQGRTLVPTAKALALWPEVRAALDRLQSALRPRAFVPAQTVCSLVLTMADATATELMLGLVQRVMAQAPGVSLRTVPLTTRDPRPLLDDGQVDLAVGHFPGVLADLALRRQSGLPVAFSHQRLFASDYVCVMRKNHPLAQAPLGLDDFCAALHVLVSFSGRAYGLIDEALAPLNRSRRVVLTVNQFFTTGKVVAESDLLTVLPRHFVAFTGFEAQLAVRELPFQVPPIQVDALWHQRMDGDGAHQWLRQQVQSVAASVPQTSAPPAP